MTTKKPKTIKGIKAFKKDMTCHGFQYEEGKAYEHKGPVKVCQRGFHFCENPFDVLSYYDLCDSEFCEVKSTGKIDRCDVAAAIGVDSTVKGKVGCWITLAEWKFDYKKERFIPVCVKSAQIDGKILKPDVWYRLKNGEFKAV